MGIRYQTCYNSNNLQCNIIYKQNLHETAQANANWKNQFSKRMVSFCIKKPRVPMNVFPTVVSLSPPYAKAYPTDQNANPPPALSNKFHNNTIIVIMDHYYMKVGRIVMNEYVSVKMGYHPSLSSTCQIITNCSNHTAHVIYFACYAHVTYHSSHFWHGWIQHKAWQNPFA